MIDEKTEQLKFESLRTELTPLFYEILDGLERGIQFAQKEPAEEDIRKSKTFSYFKDKAVALMPILKADIEAALKALATKNTQPAIALMEGLIYSCYGMDKKVLSPRALASRKRYDGIQCSFPDVTTRNLFRVVDDIVASFKKIGDTTLETVLDNAKQVEKRKEDAFFDELDDLEVFIERKLNSIIYQDITAMEEGALKKQYAGLKHVLKSETEKKDLINDLAVSAQVMLEVQKLKANEFSDSDWEIFLGLKLMEYLRKERKKKK